MKKILVISASPRKGGNSDLLADQFIKGAKEAGNEAEKIRLSEKSIHYCQGCQVCLKKGICVKPDDADEIGKKMIAADVIVFATPVYFYSMSGQLKVLIDRMCAYYEKMTGKDIYYLITAWDPDTNNLKSVLEAVRGFTLGCLTGAEEKGTIMAGGVSERGDIKTHKEYQEAYQMGLKA
jgi:putative NADPH-quinone reductase